mgnify:CR=1 FL=1
MGLKPQWDWDLVTGNGMGKMLKIKNGNGFENCEVGFGKKMNWEMGLVPPHPPPSGPSY